MTLKNLIIEELDNISVVDDLNEGWFFTTPFIAFASFKKEMFNKLNNNKLFSKMASAVTKEPAKAIKAGALVKKEQLKHDIGLRSGKGEDATVYKLTPQQIQTMSTIYKKYGSKITNEIIKFRKTILAPYQVIKRMVKKNKALSFKEVNGLSYEDYKTALESGRKKILRRKDFFQSIGSKFEKIDTYEKTIKDLEDAKKSFDTGNKIDLTNSYLDKVYEKFNISDEEMFGFTPKQLEDITNELASNFTKITQWMNSPKKFDPNSKTSPGDIISTISRNIALRTGDVKEESVRDLLASMGKENIRKGELSLALGKYMLRKQVRDEIKSKDQSMYRKYYSELIDEMINKIKSRKGDTASSAASEKESVEFNDREKKVWAKLPSAGPSEYSGKLEDYYTKITDSDFKDTARFKKPVEVEQAEKAIENEIKRFERKLIKIIGAEDVALLKRYRLINNLITVKELKDPASLFKSENELGKAAPAEEVDQDEDEDEADKKEPASQDGEEDEEDEEVSEDEFFRRIKDAATREYDTVNELNNTKKKIDSLVLQMRKQGDADVVSKHKNILMQIRIRRTTEATPLKVPSVHGEIITIHDIEQFARNMLKKRYKRSADPTKVIDEIKQDREIFDNMIEKYKQEEPEAGRNLREIQFLLDQLSRKLEGQLGQYLE